MTTSIRKRLTLGAIAISVVPLALLGRMYGAAVGMWFHNGVGAALYEVFWILVVQSVWISAPARRVAAIVFAITCVFEIAQLSRAHWLEAIRDTLYGRMLLGSNGGFDPMDFVYYAVGSALGYILCVRVAGRSQLA